MIINPSYFMNMTHRKWCPHTPYHHQHLDVWLEEEEEEGLLSLTLVDEIIVGCPSFKVQIQHIHFIS